MADESAFCGFTAPDNMADLFYRWPNITTGRRFGTCLHRLPTSTIGWYFTTQTDLVFAEITMSNIPCELLDHITDLLRDNPTSLRNCCLVSKSWVPRARKYLFAEVDFQTTGSPRLQMWKKAFPGPSTSPAHYTKDLAIGCPKLITDASAEPGTVIERSLNEYGSLTDSTTGPRNLCFFVRYLDGQMFRVPGTLRRDPLEK